MSITKITRTVVDNISSFFNINNITGEITSTIPDLIPSNTTLYPSFACRAWVNFNGVQSGTLTYTISGNTVTITQSSHGMTTGMIANLTFSTGTVSGTANYVITYLTDNTYNVTVAVSGSTGGNVVRNTFIRGSGNVSAVTRNGTGDYTVNFTTAMPDINYSPQLSSTYGAATALTESVRQFVNGSLTTTSIRMRVGYSYTSPGVQDSDMVSLCIFR